MNREPAATTIIMPGNIKRKSFVQEFFIIADPEHPDSFTGKWFYRVCKHCNAALGLLRDSHDTSALEEHFKNKHPELHKMRMRGRRLPPGPKQPDVEQEGFRLFTTNERELKHNSATQAAYLRFIKEVTEVIPMKNVSGSKAFRDFTSNLEPRYYLPSTKRTAADFIQFGRVLHHIPTYHEVLGEKWTTMEYTNTQSEHDRWMTVTESLVIFLTEDVPEGVSVKSIVEKPMFLEFVRFLDPQYVVPSTKVLNYHRIQRLLATDK